MNNLVDEFSRVHEAIGFLKSISNPNRLLILCALLKKPGLSNSEIADFCEISIPSASQYLVAMVELGMLERQKSGKDTSYYIKDKRVIEVLLLLKKLF